MADLSRPKLLVIHPGSLGDLLLSVPALRALRARFPGHVSSLMASREIGTLLKNCGEVDELLSLEQGTLAALLADGSASDPEIREVLDGCAAAVCWMSDPTRDLQRSLGQLGIGTVVVRSPHAREHRAAHQADRFLETVGAAGEWSAAWGPLRLPVAMVAEGGARLAALAPVTGSRVVIHPGSGSRHKCSPTPQLAAAVTQLKQEALWPVLLCGPADAARVADVRGMCGYDVPVLERLPLAMVAGILAGADLYIGHDSGVTHLAASVGVPTLALFGPTDAQRWGPRGSRVRILFGERCRCEQWSQVERCTEKPCLAVPAARIVAACRDLLDGHPRARPCAASGEGAT